MSTTSHFGAISSVHDRNTYMHHIWQSPSWLLGNSVWIRVVPVSQL